MMVRATVLGTEEPKQAWSSESILTQRNAAKFIKKHLGEKNVGAVL